MTKPGFIKEVFKEVIENMDADESVISRYFSPDYIQHVDGHTLNYTEFVEHMRVQKTVLESAKVSIEKCIETESKICTVHHVDAVKKNGDCLSVKLVAYFEVKDGKIICCDELTHLVHGHKTDKNIGSIK